MDAIGGHNEISLIEEDVKVKKLIQAASQKRCVLSSFVITFLEDNRKETILHLSDLLQHLGSDAKDLSPDQPKDKTEVKREIDSGEASVEVLPNIIDTAYDEFEETSKQNICAAISLHEKSNKSRKRSQGELPAQRPKRARQLPEKLKDSHLSADLFPSSVSECHDASESEDNTTLDGDTQHVTDIKEELQTDDQVDEEHTSRESDTEVVREVKCNSKSSKLKSDVKFPSVRGNKQKQRSFYSTLKKNQPFSCLLCENKLSFPHLSQFQEHFMTFHVEEKLIAGIAKQFVKCKIDECQKILYKHSSSFMVYVDKVAHHVHESHTHVEIPSYIWSGPCSECHQFMNSRHQHILHTKIQHNQASFNPMSSCQSCGIVCKQKSLYAHKKVCKARKEIADGEMKSERYVCSKCDKVFSTKGNLQSHLARIHEKDMKFLCSECPQKFFGKTDFYRHMFTHHGTNLSRSTVETCPVCGVKQLGKSSLKKHMKVHECGNHICGICHKTFKNQYVFKDHIRCHRDRERFKCSECDFKSPKKFRLRKHVEVMHRGKRWRCDHEGCCYIGASETNLKDHLEKGYHYKRKKPQKASKASKECSGDIEVKTDGCADTINEGITQKKPVKKVDSAPAVLKITLGSKKGLEKADTEPIRQMTSISKAMHLVDLGEALELPDATIDDTVIFSSPNPKVPLLNPDSVNTPTLRSVLCEEDKQSSLVRKSQDSQPVCEPVNQALQCVPSTPMLKVNKPATTPIQETRKPSIGQQVISIINTNISGGASTPVVNAVPNLTQNFNLQPLLLTNPVASSQPKVITLCNPETSTAQGTITKMVPLSQPITFKQTSGQQIVLKPASSGQIISLPITSKTGSYIQVYNPAVGSMPNVKQANKVIKLSGSDKLMNMGLSTVVLPATAEGVSTYENPPNPEPSLNTINYSSLPTTFPATSLGQTPFSNLLD